MKKIIYLFVWAGMFAMTACNDVEVGFLAADKASYSQDTLRLYNMQERLQELTALLDEFNEKAGPLVIERDAWKKKANEKRNELADFDYDEIDPVKEALEEATDPQIRAELEKRLAELYEERELIRKEYQRLLNNSTDYERQIRKLATDMGIGSERALKDKISKLKNTIEFKIPWVTPLMESIYGTEPMTYSVFEVKNEDPANAELFRKNLTIMGGGRMYVDQNVKAPPGSYIVSIRVTNEGHSIVLKDVFTFIIDKKDDINS